MTSETSQKRISDPADFDILHVNSDVMQPVDPSQLCGADAPDHPPRILLLYGSIRERSFSRLVAQESERLLKWQGYETRIFDPRGLPQPDDDDRMKPPSYYNRLVDVVEELVKFTWLTRGRTPYLVDRYSERAETAEQVHDRVSKK